MALSPLAWLIHDRENVFAEFSDGASELSAAYLYDPAELDVLYAVWRNDSLGERWLFTDTLGSVRGISNAGFAMQSWVDYDSYGQRQAGAPPAQNEPLGFAGRYWLAPLGLYDNRRRYYAPDVGRFTQEDPILFGGGDANLYRYALNNPVNMRDPTGNTSAGQYMLAILDIIAAKEESDTLKLPCLIAGINAAALRYFRPLAELLADPTQAKGRPQPDSPASLLPKGCAAYAPP